MSGRHEGSDRPHRPSREHQAISRLLVARGIGRHALFLTQREGIALPGRLESVSGFVLDHLGRVHGFWLAWDDERQALSLAPFYSVDDPDAAFDRDPEYEAARRALGLS
jgi:hypothetical protein